MKRKGIFYIDTLRTTVSSQAIKDLKSHQEVAVRTAPHPFGLGQSYWLAKALHAVKALAIPLSLRLGATPPTVQHLIKVNAAAREWQIFPIAGLLTSVFGGRLEAIATEIENIRQNPLAYSKLHALYGIAHQQLVGAEAEEAADTMMPLVDSFNHALYATEGDMESWFAWAERFAKRLQNEPVGLY